MDWDTVFSVLLMYICLGIGYHLRPWVDKQLRKKPNGGG